MKSAIPHKKLRLLISEFVFMWHNLGFTCE